MRIPHCTGAMHKGWRPSSSQLAALYGRCLIERNWLWIRLVSPLNPAPPTGSYRCLWPSLLILHLHMRCMRPLMFQSWAFVRLLHNPMKVISLPHMPSPDMTCARGHLLSVWTSWNEREVLVIYSFNGRRVFSAGQAVAFWRKISPFRLWREPVSIDVLHGPLGYSPAYGG